MDLSNEAKREVKRLVADLAAGRFGHIASDGRIGRLTEEELERAIREYGRELEDLPDAAFEAGDVFPLDDEPGVSSIDIPMWTKEEGRSDLTLSATVREADGQVTIEIDDLHVL